MTNRRERRATARKNKTEFIPMYHDDRKPQSYKEYYGVGYERFNNKFVTIAKEEK